MRHILKSLKHNGIFVPQYDYKKFTIKIRGENELLLSPKSEQMAVAWIRKRQSALSPPDKVFMKNFMQEFIHQLELENPTNASLKSFASEYLQRIENSGADDICNPDSAIHKEIDFSKIVRYLENEKQTKLSLAQTDKKRLAEQRKAQRDKLKGEYGFAEVDGQKLEIANWTAEPSCLFAGRGDHPQRGKWKEGLREEDIILNLSNPTDKPDGTWKGAVWEKDKMYVAKWEDKLTGKIKYVWFSDSAFLKQNREKEKFKKAEKLGKQIATIEAHIIRNLDAEDENRRKFATVCWLILKPNMRVGDEKDPDEADTVGAITLRPEHIRIEGDTLHFDFLGKDAVRWVKEVT